MGKLTILALRIVIVLLFGGSVFVQVVMLPLMVEGLKEVDPELHSPPGVFVGIAILGFVTVEVVLVCVWRLLTMVRRGTVFSYASFRYVHVVIGALVAAATLVFAIAVLAAPGEGVPPGVVLMMCGVVVAILGIALVVLVLRMLLAQAVALDVAAARMQDELKDVI
ncbi:DUF2975 domain-containing protein [Stackebrandtia soli]|uniref:DUF2975 domain-containing protein n=1 Tax=Stackebrandtia soli TaxID=1892856 RepID=UPI0039EB3028